MNDVLIANTGLCRGREPEYKYFRQYANITLMGYKVPGKEAERRFEDLPIIYPNIRPIFLLDPIQKLRGVYSVTSIASYVNIDSIVMKNDIIVTQDPNYFSYQVTKSAVDSKRKVVNVNFENVLKNSIFLSPLYRRATNYILHNSDIFIPQTRKALEFLTKNGVPIDRTKMIYPGVDTSLFSPSIDVEERQHNNSNNKTKFLFVGTLTHTKGVLELVNAFLKLHDKEPNTELILVGSGYLKSSLSQYKNNECIIHLENLDANQMADLYRSSDIFVMLSRARKIGPYTVGEEQLSFALLEALSSGLPIITTDSGSIKEVVGEDNITVNANNEQEIIDKMYTLYNDPKVRKRIGEKNRKRAISLFDARKQSKEFMQYVLNEK